MKNIIKLIFFICLISILQFSCSITSTDSTTKIKPKIPLLDGKWIILDIPNDLDCPGRIFAYNKLKDKIIPITTLKVNKKTGKSVLPYYKETKKMKMGFLLNFLGYKKVDIGAKTNFDIDSKIQSTVKYDETKLDRSELLDMTDTIKDNTKKIQNMISVLKLQNYRFFIILESISAKSLLYQFDQQTIVDQNLNINLRRIAQLNENIDWDTKQEYQLSYKLKKPLYVIIKPFELTTQGSITGNTKIILGDNNIGKPLLNE